MPQHQRKKPFSAKKKKEQLQAKRNRKKKMHDSSDVESGRSSAAVSDGEEDEVRELNQQPPSSSSTKGYDPNRYRLHFVGESAEELERRKRQSHQPLATLTEDDLETNVDDVFVPGSVLDMPKRPKWDYKTKKAVLEFNEETYFKGYLEGIFEQHPADRLSYLELNLETWRQLWRVLEMSDIVLLIVDIRYPAQHFSPSLCHHVMSELKKSLILVLNKVDLAPPGLVAAWRQYFLDKFPGIQVVCFTSQPREDPNDKMPDSGLKLNKKRRRITHSSVGPRSLFHACENLVQGQVDLSSWQEKIVEDEKGGGVEAGPDCGGGAQVDMIDSSFHSHELYRDGVLTIGCCGYPNVGKSSLLNGLVGRKVVSVSRTPGHTKHFQTIFLTPSVKLCDSPGLVFPSLVPKPLQILTGIYPIAQVREPYSAVGYLAERVPLVTILHLIHPEAQDRESETTLQWSAYYICEAWAIKRGFITAKAARPDVYRAANHLLRLALQGRLCLCTRPPHYTTNKESWEKHEFSQEITRLQITHSTESSLTSEVTDDSDQDESDDKSESDGERHIVASNPFSVLTDE